MKRVKVVPIITNFFKNCPKCNSIQYFKNKYKYNRALENNTLCKSCAANKRAESGEYCKKLSIGVKKACQNPETKIKKSESMKKFIRLLPSYKRDIITERSKKALADYNIYYNSLSYEEKKKIIDKRKRIWTLESKQKYSLIQKKLWSNKDYRDRMISILNNQETMDKRKKTYYKNFKLGKHNYSLERRQAASILMKNRMVNEEIRNKVLEALRNSKNKRGRESKLEILVANNLKHLNFIHHQKILGYYVDIINYEYNIIIEVNGDYWHANPEKYNDDWVNPNSNLTAKQIQDNDQKRKDKFEKAGYKVVFLWEKDIKGNFDYVLYIENIIKGLKP